MNYFVSKVNNDDFDDKKYWHYIKRKNIKKNKTAKGDIVFCYDIKNKNFAYAVEFIGESKKSDRDDFCFMRKIKKLKLNFNKKSKSNLYTLFNKIVKAKSGKEKIFFDIFKYWQDITILSETKIYKQEKSELSEILLSQVE